MLVDDALVVVPGHEALERRERARGEHVEVGELARGQLELLELLDPVGARAGAVDQLAAVGLDQRRGLGDAHAVTSAGDEAKLLELGDDDAALSSGSCCSVSTTSSGFDGSS